MTNLFKDLPNRVTQHSPFKFAARVLILFSFWTLCSESWLNGDEEAGKASEHTEEIAKDAMSLVKENWERLYRGEVRAYGVTRRYHFGESMPKAEDQPLSSMDLEFYIAFDYVDNLYRIDRTEGLQSEEGSQEKLTTQWINTPEQSVRFGIRTPETDRETPHTISITHADEKNTGAYRPFIDIRTLAVSQNKGLRGLEYRYQTWLKQHDELWKVRSAVRPDENTSRVTWVFTINNEPPEFSYLNTILFDSLQGGMPTYSERMTDTPNNKPSETSSATWTRIGDVWLPDSIQTVGLVMGNPDQWATLDLKLEWIRVNDPIPESVFTWKGLLAPKGTHVIDSRLDQRHPIIIATVGENEIVSQPLEVPVPEQNTTLRYLVIITNLIVILCVVIYVLWRRRSRNQTCS